MTPGLVLSDTTGGQVLQGSPLADTLSGAGGNDTLAGGVGNDTYLFNRGYGRETISDPNYITGLDQNIIRLGGGIAPSDVTLQTNVNGNLLLDITGTADQLIIWSYFNDPVYRAFDVNFTDGTSCDVNMILSQASGMVRTDTAGGQFLQGSPLADTLSGAGGNDTLAGGAGDNTYLANLGYGTTTITDSSSGNNRLVFGPGINPSSLTLQWDSQSLALVSPMGIKVTGFSCPISIPMVHLPRSPSRISSLLTELSGIRTRFSIAHRGWCSQIPREEHTFRGPRLQIPYRVLAETTRS